MGRDGGFVSEPPYVAETLLAVANLLEQRGFSPTVRDVGDALGRGYTATNRRLWVLVDLGYLHREEHAARTVRLSEQGVRAVRALRGQKPTRMVPTEPKVVRALWRHRDTDSVYGVELAYVDGEMRVLRATGQLGEEEERIAVDELDYATDRWSEWVQEHRDEFESA